MYKRVGTNGSETLYVKEKTYGTPFDTGRGPRTGEVEEVVSQSHICGTGKKGYRRPGLPYGAGNRSRGGQEIE